MKRKPPRPRLKLVKPRRRSRKPASRELAPVDQAKRREILVGLMAENRSSKEICRKLKLTPAEFNRLIRETPELQDEVHAIVQASSIAERPANLRTRIQVRDKDRDGRNRLMAADAIDRTAGVLPAKENGLPTIVIMGREVNVQAAPAKDLEAVLRTAARKIGDGEVKKYVDAAIAGTPLAAADPEQPGEGE